MDSLTELFCDVDDFCQSFVPEWQKQTLSKAKIKILLADDHHIVRAGIRQLLEGAGDLQVIAEAGDGEEAQSLIEKHRPDVAVLDI